MTTTKQLPKTENSIWIEAQSGLSMSATSLFLYRQLLRDTLPKGRVADEIDDLLSDAQHRCLTAAVRATEESIKRSGSGREDPPIEPKADEPEIVAEGEPAKPATLPLDFTVGDRVYHSGQKIEYRFAEDGEVWRDGIFSGYDKPGYLRIGANGGIYLVAEKNVRPLAKDRPARAPVTLEHAVS